MNKEKYFIDLSKLSEEEIKALPQIFENSGDKVLPETLSDLISGKITDGFKFLFYSPSGWNQNDYPLNGRTELTYPEFIKLFEGGDETIYSIDFNGNVMAGLKIINGEIEVIGAVNGWGDNIPISDIRITKVINSK